MQIEMDLQQHMVKTGGWLVKHVGFSPLREISRATAWKQL